MKIRNLTIIQHVSDSELIFLEVFSKANLEASGFLLLTISVLLYADLALNNLKTDVVDFFLYSLIQIILLIPIIFFFWLLFFFLRSAIFKEKLVITVNQIIIYSNFLFHTYKKTSYSTKDWKVYFYNRSVYSSTGTSQNQISLMNYKNNLQFILKYLYPDSSEEDEAFLKILSKFNLPFHDSAKEFIEQLSN